MKVEIRCPFCERGYLIDEVALGSELVCPACAGLIRLQSPAGGEPAGDTRRAPRDTAEEPLAGDESTQIVCPRCKLHFKPRAALQPRPGERRHTVLIVEDMRYFRKIAEDALSADYQIKTAKNVEEAERILADGGIDLMVLDLTLEGGDEGRRLLTGQSRKSCPILIYTARDESELYGKGWEDLHRMGADDIVIKGMKVGESLVRKVGVLLGTSLDEPESIR
jgi:CheY-like chemotaxis protein